MRITCPNCNASFQIADGALGATGRKVRCARCGSVWHAVPGEDAQEDPIDEADLDAAFDDRPAPIPEPGDDEWKAALSDDDAPPTDRRDEAGSSAGEADDDETVTDAASTDLALAGDAADDGRDGLSADVAPEGAVRTVEAVPAAFAAKSRAKSRKKAKPGPTALAGLARRLTALPPMVANGAAIGLIGAVVMLGFFARESLVSAVPDFAKLYEAVGLPVNLRGLTFEDVRTYREVEGATPVLVIEGIVRMVETSGERPVPQLRFSLISSTGREVYAWTMDPARSSLRSGESFRFKSRLAAPPEAAVDAQVRFMDRRGP